MSSFQNDAISFMTNGKVTVRTLQQLGLIATGQCVIPNQFYESGWGQWLPMPNVLSLPYISHYIASGLNKKEIILQLEQKDKINTFINFTAPCPPHMSSKEQDENELLHVREAEIKRRLEANHYNYPQNILDVINLYISLGLVHEIDDEGTSGMIDLLIRPLPHMNMILLVD
ncbi:DUF6042 family protein [Paenibacillus ferrarius]|uniref:DUF6042 family protein n=1 Tax=Paenibacillus ferrarius TaxID=1469647 RepID=UPI003D2B7B13